MSAADMDTTQDGANKAARSTDKKPMSFSMGFSKLGQIKKEGGASTQISERKAANRISADSMVLDADSLRKLAAPKAKEQVVIPLIPNKWRPEDVFKGKEDPSVKDEPAVKTEPGTSVEDEAAAALIADAKQRLMVKSENDTLEERAALVAPIGPMSEEERLRIDLETRPEEMDVTAPGMIERYEATPVDDFGMGMLMGMGWKPGQGIGRNPKIIEPTVLNIRGHRQGLGADMVKPSDRGPKKFIKPGESREQRIAKPKVVVSAADSRSALFQSIQDRMIKVKGMTLGPGALVEVLEGEHAKLYGRVVKVIGMKKVTIRQVIQKEKETHLPPTLKSERQKQLKALGQAEEEEEEEQEQVIEKEEDWNMVEVKLNRSGEVVEIPRHYFELLDERALPDDHPALRVGSSLVSSASSSSVSTPPPSGKKRSRSKSRDRERDRREKERDGGSKRYKAEEREERERDKPKKRKRSRSRSKEKKRKDKKDKDRDRGRDDRAKEKETEKKKDSDRITWVVPHIRVRVVSKSLGGGKYYQLKGRVEDVVDQYRFTLIMDGSGKVLEDVHQRHVETALPKAGGQVRVLAGEYKGEVGQLLERNSATSQGVVRLDSELTSVIISFDDMAEWAGQSD